MRAQLSNRNSSREREAGEGEDKEKKARQQQSLLCPHLPTEFKGDG